MKVAIFSVLAAFETVTRAREEELAAIDRLVTEALKRLSTPAAEL